MSDGGPPVTAHRPHLVLVGYRGCGKSTVARLAAARLGRPHADTDERVERSSGCTIRELFAQFGEPEFRARETAVLAAVLDESTPHVVSVGGGAVLLPENRERIRRRGWCAWLTASPDELLKRTAGDPRTPATRPPLTAADLLDEVRALLAARTPLYQEVADCTVSTSGHSAAEVANEIVRRYLAAGGSIG